ncbi:MAG: hypothetical protein LQ338_003938 [Usnochroma carphineum]|nr:MAG: hypothetical protein LQ338_003938 [Usnochroma carphineum]
MFVLQTLFYCLHLAFLVIAQLPPPASPGTDACGPFDHTRDAGFSTCTASVVPGGPSPYGISCGRDSSITVPIKTGSCATSAMRMCYTLATTGFDAGEWHWTGDMAGSPCRVGLFLSAAESAAPIPNYRRCLNQIFQPMVFSCVTHQHNVATVNIKQLPDYTRNFSGATVNPGYHAFAVAPTALFYSNDPLATPGYFGSPLYGVTGLGNGTLESDLRAAQQASHGQVVNTEAGRNGVQTS